MHFSYASSGRVWTVVPGGSVIDAVNKAGQFDTVYIKSGTYAEAAPVEIKRPIVLIGEGWPILDGQHRQQVISVRSSFVAITGLHVRSCGQQSMEDLAGIKVYNSRQVYIYNNILEDNYFGIYLSACIQCWVSGNHIHASGTAEQSSGNGIHAWKCDSISILDNRVEGHRDGIYFEFVTHSAIKRNFSTRNIRYGLHFMFSHNDYYADNTFLANGAGVAVMYSRQVTMLRNLFRQNQGAAAYGILLKDIQASRLADNLFQENTTAVFMEGCTRTMLERNVFSENGWAIRVQASCDSDTFRYNNFFFNTFDIATNNQLVLNLFSENYWDKYEGYDLNRDGHGDVPHRPVSLFSMISEQMPYAMMFWRSLTATLLDRTEKVVPSISPERMRDDSPLMNPYVAVAAN